ncbi:protein-L-isoaspartate(D-aspartate) O-methyltransferase [Frankia sp. AiPs1]|uniref:methyltransferase, FxLD system n=1 Tax=Frankia sp. AiPa1 TaxID=573492 RepID=UPI00202B5692|nr:methyltransferase, FxLD system [Frankia sp. AiPa1]MCL9762776.1 methyltransferase, FxLD system [Frankia sp. AiPa1]
MTTLPTSDGWRQLNLVCTDWQAAEQMAVDHLRPLLTDAENAGTVQAWWFVRKGDTWRLRLRTPDDTALNELANTLQRHGALHTWTESRYEPETHAFGGPDGMDLAHDLFAADSRHLLDHLATARPHLRRELPVILSTRLLRTAGLETYERGDCWNRLADHRTPPAPATPPGRQTLLDIQTLITADSDTSGSPLHAAPAWPGAFEHAGRGLAALTATGQLARGLRGVLTHHLIFLFNRHGISATDQRTLATAARTTIFGPIDTPWPTTTGPIAPPTITSDIPDTSVHSHRDIRSGANANGDGAQAPAADAPDSREQQATRLRHGLADYIKGWGTFRTPRIEAAFRAVPRHLFLPGIDLDIVYGTKPIVTRRAADGTSHSSASSPKLVATMLEQLDPQPGQRVLEIGTATGINAALLAELVGDNGAVTTIELDDDLAASATHHLHTAGYQTHVICGDGALGYPGHAPYDRLIVTAEATDIPPAWWDQLGLGGRAVIPLRLHGSGLTRALAFDHHTSGQMTSTSAVVCGFVPMRATTGHDEHASGHIRLADDVILKIDTTEPHDPTALAQVLRHSPRQRWTGIHVRHDEPAEHLDLWLATSTNRPFGRLSVGPTARNSGLADPALRWAGAALYENSTLAYLTAREPTDDALELGITAHGPEADKLTAHLADLLDAWAPNRPTRPIITAYRSSDPVNAEGARAHIQRPHTQFTITW